MAEAYQFLDTHFENSRESWQKSTYCIDYHIALVPTSHDRLETRWIMDRSYLLSEIWQEHILTLSQ